jgi:ankyrin repeat protein
MGMKSFGVFLLLFAFNGCKSQGSTIYGPGFNFALFRHTPVRELAAAVEADDTARIRAAIAVAKGDIVYQETKFGNSLLTLAVVDNKPRATKMLLEFGANPNLHSPHDNPTPFLAACRYFDYNLKNWKENWRQVLALLIDYGADVNDSQTMIQHNGPYAYALTKTALAYVVTFGTVEIVKLLLDKGARLDIYPKNGPGSILFLSAHNPDVLRYLLIEKGVPIPDYPVIREEGTVNEKKLSLKELLVENTIGENSLRREQYNEILAFLDRHGN